MAEPSYEVLLIKGAEQDLEAIYDYIAEFDCVISADYVLDSLLEVVEGLACFPERGSYPKEVAGLGIKEFRQALFKPYRVIYRVIGPKVYIMQIADCRLQMVEGICSLYLRAGYWVRDHNKDDS